MLDTRLSILNTSVDDTGVYTCKILSNTTSKVLFSLNFTLFAEKNETATNQGDYDLYKRTVTFNYD